jgi:phosphomannomutase
MNQTRIVSISGLRGVVGQGIDPRVVVDYVAGYVAGLERGPVVVGHDGRASVPAFEPAVIAAVLGSGRDVLRAGPVATPTLGILVRDHCAAGGVQISASHNPAIYNGIKLFERDGTVLRPGGAEAVKQRFEAGVTSWCEWGEIGAVRELGDAAGSHLARVLDIVDVPAIRRRGFRVFLDSCHGGGGELAARLLRDELGCAIWHLGGAPDGRYDHPPEPLGENLVEVGRMAAGAGADVGFVQDPDADRLAILDEAGRYIGEEATLALAALRRLDQFPGPVVINLSTSRMTEALAEARGCALTRVPVGEIHVVEGMRAEGAVLGGEGNGGVIDPRVGYVRDSFVAMALVLDLLAARGEPVSRVAGELPRYHMVKRKYPAGNRPVSEILERLCELGGGEASIDRRDGLRLAWSDGAWVQVRGSNTEPIVRVIAEAPEARAAEELAERMGRVIASGATAGA